MNPYARSTAVQRWRAVHQVGRQRRIAFLDLDGTWAGPPSEQQVVRDLLDARGYVICHVTSRLAASCMSWRERARSSPAVRRRSPSAVDPATVEGFNGLIDPDIIISASGTDILVRQVAGGYWPDMAYRRRGPRWPRAWRLRVHQGLEVAAKRFTFTVLGGAETDCRLQLVASSEWQAVELATCLGAVPGAAKFHLARDRENIFITPAAMSKEDAAEHVLASLARMLPVAVSEVALLLAGDSTAEAAMGMRTGVGTPAVFLVPGGASLAREIDLTDTEKDATLPAGVYKVKNQSRLVVIGDEAFPGTRGPQTLIAWLRRSPA